MTMTPTHQLSRRTLLRSTLAPVGVSLTAGLAGCSTPTTPVPEPAASATAPSSRARGRVLLAFFSRAGENYHYGDRIDQEVGNTAVVAGMIADAADVDVYEIKAADPYPDDYEATVQRNTREQDEDARPAIAGALPDLGRYEVVLLGSGVWNVRAPMIMRTFVDGLDFTGKTVFPLVTHAVSGMGRVADEYAETCTGATMGEGLAVQGEEADRARPEVAAWLRSIGLRPE